VKRTIDVMFATLALIATAPIFLVVAAINWRGGVFFRQRRVGLGGAEFTCLKFRSMIPGAAGLRDQVEHLNITNGPTFKCARDPRLTRFGYWLRRTSLDELPQLVNVLRGEMSLVGPRPLVVAENQYAPGQEQRLSVKPGLTCTWQVSGRSNIPFGEWMRMDLDYVDSRSFLRDLYLLVRTVPAVVKGDGAL
jgi:lipopolysaccharide/colanic/teichoic acid biosynthesis glycosyltransferase